MNKTQSHVALLVAATLGCLGNSNISLPPQNKAVFVTATECSYPAGAALMSVQKGAGYYSDGWGPAPFILGSPPTETYYIYHGR